MYRLSQFNRFDFNSWSKDKSFGISNVKYNAKKGCVTVQVVILEDYTDYGDTTDSNLYEKFNVHCVRDIDESDVNKYKIGQKIRFKSLGKISVWGDYQSQLTVEAIIEGIDDDNK